MNKDKYRWHDLRKDQNDLPELDSTIVYAFKMRDVGSIGYNTMLVDKGFLEITKNQANQYAEHIAWKYIEPFEDDMEVNNGTE